jgi:hypothetical protein
MKNFDLRKFLAENREAEGILEENTRLNLEERVFSAWDQFINDDRAGITKSYAEGGTQFIFEENSPNFTEFLAAVFMEIVDAEITFKYNPALGSLTF